MRKVIWLLLLTLFLISCSIPYEKQFNKNQTLLTNNATKMTYEITNDINITNNNETMKVINQTVEANNQFQLEPLEIEIKDSTFYPGEAYILYGMTAIWINKDNISHVLQASDGSFCPTRLLPEESRNYTFNSVGLYEYTLDSNPSMWERIIVQKPDSYIFELKNVTEPRNRAILKLYDDHVDNAQRAVDSFGIKNPSIDTSILYNALSEFKDFRSKLIPALASCNTNRIQSLLYRMQINWYYFVHHDKSIERDLNNLTPFLPKELLNNLSRYCNRVFTDCYQYDGLSKDDCEQMTDKCYNELAVVLDNPLYCLNAANREGCFDNLLKINKDITTCDYYNISSCYSFLAKEFNRPELCWDNDVYCKAFFLCVNDQHFFNSTYEKEKEYCSSGYNKFYRDKALAEIEKNNQITIPDSNTNEVLIQNFKFTPSYITIKVGTTVTWTNKDLVPHSIKSKDGTFDSGELKKGESWSYTFNEQQSRYFFYLDGDRWSRVAEISIQVFPKE